MEQNKIRTYILYAIGEILLVVIGILIALQLNNWNDHRKGVEISRGFLNEMLGDLAADRQELGRHMEAIEERWVYQRWFLSNTQFTTADIDSIVGIFAGGYHDFYINDDTYVRIQNSGQSELIGFDDLNEHIGFYYSEIKRRALKNTEFEIREATRNTPAPERFRENYDIVTHQRLWGGLDSVETEFTGQLSEEALSTVLLERVNSVEFRNSVYTQYGRHRFIHGGFKRFDDEARKLTQLIEESLGN